MQIYVDKVSAEVRYIANVWQKHDELLQFVNSKLRIEQYLSAMESAHAHWLQQLTKFNRQKVSLELGFLSRQELNKIVTSARAVGFYAPAAQRYYANLRISSIFRSVNELLFRVKHP